MEFSKPTADVYVPDGLAVEAAVGRCDYLCIGAHQDDLEIMAYHGISECYDSEDHWFAGVTVTNGAGSSRTGLYSDYTDEQMQEVRREEQRKAAELGNYGIQIQLDYASAELKDNESDCLVQELVQLLQAARPKLLYLHSPFDKHETHIAVLARCLAALKRLDESCHPECVLGCEVWRDLDWLPDSEKEILDTSKHPELAEKLLKVFDSQISGGKRFDLATLGRRRANATFHQSHKSDQVDSCTFAVDLKPLLGSGFNSMGEFVESMISRFANDAVSVAKRYQ